MLSWTYETYTGLFGGGVDEATDTGKSEKMRQELAARRQERDQGSASRANNKGKLSQMWAENKAKNQAK
jgi:hypothetical protein